MLRALRDHYYAAVMAAEIGYRLNAVNEEATTALRQALLTPNVRYIVDEERLYGWRPAHTSCTQILAEIA